MRNSKLQNILTHYQTYPNGYSLEILPTVSKVVDFADSIATPAISLELFRELEYLLEVYILTPRSSRFLCSVAKDLDLPVAGYWLLKLFGPYTPLENEVFNRLGGKLPKELAYAPYYINVMLRVVFLETFLSHYTNGN